MALPEPLPGTARIEPVKVDSQAFIHLDTNRYSVPSDYASRVVTLVVDDRTIRLVNGDQAIADHPRSWGRRQIFEKPEHRAALLDERRAARNLKGRDRLRAVVPAFDRIVTRWDLAGSSLGYRVARVIKLLDLYGDQVFAAAAEDLAALLDRRRCRTANLRGEVRRTELAARSLCPVAALSSRFSAWSPSTAAVAIGLVAEHGCGGELRRRVPASACSLITNPGSPRPAPGPLGSAAPALGNDSIRHSAHGNFGRQVHRADISGYPGVDAHVAPRAHHLEDVRGVQLGVLVDGL